LLQCGLDGSPCDEDGGRRRLLMLLFVDDGSTSDDSTRKLKDLSWPSGAGDAKWKGDVRASKRELGDFKNGFGDLSAWAAVRAAGDLRINELNASSIDLKSEPSSVLPTYSDGVRSIELLLLESMRFDICRGGENNSMVSKKLFACLDCQWIASWEQRRFLSVQRKFVQWFVREPNMQCKLGRYFCRCHDIFVWFDVFVVVSYLPDVFLFVCASCAMISAGSKSWVRFSSEIFSSVSVFFSVLFEPK
jgi:hypothetical protein